MPVLAHSYERVMPGREYVASIRDFWRQWPEARLLDAWREAGLSDGALRRMSLGGGVVVWGRRG